MTADVDYDKGIPALPNLAPYAPEPGRPPAILCDIDGTLAIHQGRKPFEWGRCGEDAPNAPVVDYLQMVNGTYCGPFIILVSGRPETAREMTEDWLRRHLVPFDELRMRADGDYRNDVIVKSELFDRHVRNRFNVQLALDDRDRCVRLWRDLGLSCWQVNDGDF